MKFHLLFCGALCLQCLSAGLAAKTMRCGVHLIGVNTSMYEVLKKCGEPTRKAGNVWYYESSTKFTREVHFDFYDKVLYVKPH